MAAPGALKTPPPSSLAALGPQPQFLAHLPAHSQEGTPGLSAVPPRDSWESFLLSLFLAQAAACKDTSVTVNIHTSIRDTESGCEEACKAEARLVVGEGGRSCGEGRQLRPSGKPRTGSCGFKAVPVAGMWVADQRLWGP